MKLRNIYVIIILLFLLKPVLASFECHYEAHVDILLKAFDEDEPTKESKYQFPEYKEDDILRLWKVFITNDGNCTLSEQLFEIELSSPQELYKQAFCTRHRIPSLEPNQSYAMWYQGIGKKIIGNEEYYLYEYKDTQNQDISLCGITLLHDGIWEGQPKLEPKRGNGTYLEGLSWRVIYDKNKVDNLFFKVREKSEMLSLESQRWSKLLSIIAVIVTIIIGLSGIVAQRFLTNHQIKVQDDREYDKQKNLLENIQEHLENVDETIKGHKEMLSREKPEVPSFMIPKFDSTYYVTRLNKKINEKDTKTLRQLLLELENKTNTLNQVLDLLQRTDSIQQRTRYKDLMEEFIDKKFKYHNNITETLEKIKKELPKLLKSK